MKKTTIHVAGINFEIVHQYDQNARFRGFTTDSEPSMSFMVNEDDIEAELSANQNLFARDYLEFISIYRKIAEVLPCFDAFVMHGAVISKDNRSYVFTAPGGTGKTTHIQLWRKCFPDCWILNGDKPIIRKHNGIFYACGTPWKGKELLGTNRNKRIQSICFLKRSPDNRIDRLLPTDAVDSLMQQVYLSKEPDHLATLLSLIDELLQTVPFFTLHCNMEQSAAQTAYRALSDVERRK